MTSDSRRSYKQQSLLSCHNFTTSCNFLWVKNESDIGEVVYAAFPNGTEKLVHYIRS